ncbi:MAG: 30S ribosome-binding factor RbfA [Myxococcales bacterium]|nr:30S ribosome-binding factor RbfA [Myxococcales bacterium]
MSRAVRIAGEIQRELSDLIRAVRDPRVQAATLVTIAHVGVSDDLGVARVHVSVIGEDPEGVLKGLERAKGFLQNGIGRALHSKRIPELRFVLDGTEAKVDRIDEILREIHADSVSHSPGRDPESVSLSPGERVGVRVPPENGDLPDGAAGSDLANHPPPDPLPQAGERDLRRDEDEDEDEDED